MWLGRCPAEELARRNILSKVCTFASGCIKGWRSVQRRRAAPIAAKVAPVNARCATVGFLDANLPLIFVLSDVYQRRSVHAVV